MLKRTMRKRRRKINPRTQKNIFNQTLTIFQNELEKKVSLENNCRNKKHFSKIIFTVQQILSPSIKLKLNYPLISFQFFTVTFTLV